MRQHADAVLQQFDAQAAAYLASPVHAAGPDLEWVRTQLLPTLPAGGCALDVGCGAGHLAFALAERLAAVVALDPAPSMLQAVADHADRAGLPIETCQGQAGKLPFADGRFDLVATRYSAHHWLHLPCALAEMRRVLKPGGTLLLIDVLGEEDALVDTHLQALELLRDPSHIRNRAPSEWRRLLPEAGFELLQEQAWPLRLAFAAWVGRMRTPALQQQAIRALQAGAPQEVGAALGFEADGSFSVHTGLMLAR